MIISNSINTPLHVVNFVASLSNFAIDRNLLFRGSDNYTRFRFTFCGSAHLGDEHCVKYATFNLQNIIRPELVLWAPPAGGGGKVSL